MNKLLNFLLIRQDEKVRVFYFTSLFFIIGCGNAMGKTSAEVLFFKRYGLEYLPIMFVLLAVTLTFISIIYAAFVDKLSAEKFYSLLFSVLVVIIALSWWAINYTSVSLSYPIYYLIYEAASEILLIHSALYLSQNLCTTSLKRLSPIILAGTQLGIIFGGLLVALLAPLIGTTHIILLWAGLLFTAILLIKSWHSKNGVSPYFYHSNQKSNFNNAVNAVKQGLLFSKQSSLLRFSAYAFLFLVVSFYLLYYLTNDIYIHYFDNEKSLMAFFGVLTATTGIISLIIQIFITNRVVNKWGVQKVNLLFPVVIAGSFLGLLVLFKLPMAVLSSVVKDSLNASFNIPARNLMLNVLPQNYQGRSRAVFTGIVLPVALLISASILYYAQDFENKSQLVIFGVISSLLFLWFSLKMNKVYLKTLIKHLQNELYFKQHKNPNSVIATDLAFLENNILSSNNQLALQGIKTLLVAFPEQLKRIVALKLMKADAKISDQIIKMVAKHDISILADYLKRLKSEPKNDNHLKATVLNALFNKQHVVAKSYVLSTLKNTNPRLCATGVLGSYCYSKQNILLANKYWLKLTQGNTNQQIASLQLVPLLTQVERQVSRFLFNNYQQILLRFLQSESVHYQLQVFHALANWPLLTPPVEIVQLVKCFNHTDFKIRQAIVKSVSCFSLETAYPLLLKACNDGHLLVRQSAFKMLLTKFNDVDKFAEGWLQNKASPLTPVAKESLIDFLMDKELTQARLKSIAKSQMRISKNYYDALQLQKQVKDNSPQHYLLVCTLAERLKHNCLILLTCIEPFENSQQIAVVKTAIECDDKSILAKACEAIKNLNNQYTDLLLDVLQDNFELKPNYQLAFKDADEALLWCQSQDDWLKELSTKANSKIA